MERLSKSVKPPSLFRFKIGSFSSLANSSIEKFESCEFDAGDYKWKLALYPNGNKEKGGKDHISLYLMLASKDCIEPNDEILVSFRLFVLDDIRDKDLSVQEVSRFDAKKAECGFVKFISLEMFNDSSNGYLVDDTCMFGVEVFSVVSVAKGLSSSVNSNHLPFKYRWKVENFSKLKGVCYSETFKAWGYDWRMTLYPRGDLYGKHPSLFLEFADPNLYSGTEVFVEFKLCVIDQVNRKRIVLESLSVILGKLRWGISQIILLSTLKRASSGYLVNDTCILEAVIVTARNAVSDDESING